MSGLPLGKFVSNLKSVALTVSELLAFNSYRSAAHKHRNRRTPNEHIISAIHFVHLAEIIMAMFYYHNDSIVSVCPMQRIALDKI